MSQRRQSPPLRKSRQSKPSRSKSNRRSSARTSRQRSRLSVRTLVAGVLTAIAITSAIVYFVISRTQSPEIAADATSVSTEADVSDADAPEPTVTLADASTGPTLVASSSDASLAAVAPELGNIQELLLAQINEERSAAGLASVDLFDGGVVIAMEHAQEMAKFGHSNNLNIAGMGPEERYAQSQLNYFPVENVYLFEGKEISSPQTQSEWEDIVYAAQGVFLSNKTQQKPILSPATTHVSLGAAYDETSGRLAIVQDFSAQLAQLNVPSSTLITPGVSLSIEGTLNANIARPYIAVFYETNAEPLAVSELNSLSEPYVFSGVQLTAKDVTATETGAFSITLDTTSWDDPGKYHVVLIGFVNGKQIFLNTILFTVPST